MIEVYADGGCRGNGTEGNRGGWGVYLSTINNGQPMSKELFGYVEETTNNQMELTAAIQGLLAIKPNSRHKPVTLYTDSNYVVRGLNEWLQSWKARNWRTAAREPVKNKELWQVLDEIVQSYSNLQVVWVKGHSDNYGNIKADNLANYAMDIQGNSI